MEWEKKSIKMLKQEYGNWKKLYQVLAVVLIIGIVGRFIPIGYASWNFLFENMIWFPIDLAVMIFVVDKIVNRNNEKIGAIREFSEYYSVAGDSLESLVHTIKYQMISGVTNGQTEDENIDEKFTDVCLNLTNYVSVDKLREGHNAPIINPDNVLESLLNMQYSRKSFYISLPESSYRILDEIDAHFNLFLKYIPIDLFKEINQLKDKFEHHPHFSRNGNLAFGRTLLLQREEQNLMKDSEYQETVDLLVDFYGETIEMVESIEKKIKENKEKIS